MAELTEIDLDRLLDALESIADSLKDIAEGQPGPCESYIGPLLPPKGTKRTYCTLRSGHKGMHEGSDGSSWTERN